MSEQFKDIGFSNMEVIKDEDGSIVLMVELPSVYWADKGKVVVRKNSLSLLVDGIPMGYLDGLGEFLTNSILDLKNIKVMCVTDKELPYMNECIVTA